MPLVQLVERRFPKPNAVGSSPTGHVFLKPVIFVYVVPGRCRRSPHCTVVVLYCSSANFTFAKAALVFARKNTGNSSLNFRFVYPELRSGNLSPNRNGVPVIPEGATFASQK